MEPTKMENMQDSASLFKNLNNDFLERTKWCGICHYPLIQGVCQHCAEVKAMAAEDALRKKEFDIRRLGGVRAYEDFTLETFDDKYYNAKEVIRIAQESGNLWIWGKRGTGKTHLATALLRRKPTGLVITPQTILRAIKEKVLEAEKEQAEIDFYVKHPALCIDDLGSEKLTAHTRSILYEITNGRWQNKGYGLIVTSNFGPDELSAHLEDDRIVSRIAGLCRIIELTGEDRRIKA